MGGRVARNINTQVVPYEFQEFPRILHKPGGVEKRVGNDAEKEAALAEGWELLPSPAPEAAPSDTPAAVVASDAAPVAKGKKAKD